MSPRVKACWWRTNSICCNCLLACTATQSTSQGGWVLSQLLVLWASMHQGTLHDKKCLAPEVQNGDDSFLTRLSGARALCPLRPPRTGPYQVPSLEFLFSTSFCTTVHKAQCSVRTCSSANQVRSACQHLRRRSHDDAALF